MNITKLFKKDNTTKKELEYQKVRQEYLKARRRRRDIEYIRFLLIMPRPLRDRLKKRADRYGVSMTSLIIEAIDRRYK